TLLLPLCALVLAAQDPGGPELIERLQNDATRTDALMKLVERGKGEAGERRDPLLTICPQEDGKPPLYVVLSKFLAEKDAVPADTATLFGPPSPGRRMNERLIDVFKADGTLINPFGGDNVIDDGVLLDLNGDG